MTHKQSALPNLYSVHYNLHVCVYVHVCECVHAVVSMETHGNLYQQQKEDISEVLH